MCVTSSFSHLGSFAWTRTNFKVSFSLPVCDELLLFLFRIPVHSRVGSRKTADSMRGIVGDVALLLAAEHESNTRSNNFSERVALTRGEEPE